MNVYSTTTAYCARNATGFVKCWGFSAAGVTGAPTDGGYVTLYSSQSAFLGMRANGSWTVWGSGNYGGHAGGNAAYVPTGQIFKRVFSTSIGFAALTASGKIFSWGGDGLLSGYPSGTGFTEVYSTSNSFAAIHPSNGSVYAWGTDVNIKNASLIPPGLGWKSLVATTGAFCAIHTNGSLYSWGTNGNVGGYPTSGNWTRVVANSYGWVAMDADGYTYAWGNTDYVGSPGGQWQNVYAISTNFVFLASNGSYYLFPRHPAWSPIKQGNTTLYTAANAAVVQYADGSLNHIGTRSYEPGYISVNGGPNGFIAIHQNGSLVDGGTGWAGAPTDSDFSAVYSSGNNATLISGVESEGTAVYEWDRWY